MIRRLSASLNFGGPETPIARLGWDGTQRHVAAEWTPEFQRSPLPLSPLLLRQYSTLLRPRGRAFGDLPGLFGDSLPDGWGRLLIDRDLAARGRSASGITDLDRLAMVGSDGMGALAYHPEEPQDLVDELSLDWFDNLVPKVGEADSADDLERLRQIVGGSQGARPKFVAQLSDDKTRLRDHREHWATGWRHVLVKRRAINDPVGAVEAEAAYAELGRRAGIKIAETTILRATGGEPFLASLRFDREGTHRFHMQTAAALLDADFRTATMDYSELLKLVRIVTRDQRDVEEMFRRMVFNARCLNRDDHLKNHALLMDQTGNWRLSPAYDVSFSAGPGGEHSLLIGGEGRRPGLEAFEAVAKASGIKERVATGIVAQVDEALTQWAQVADEAQVPEPLRAEITRAMAQAADW